MTQTLEQLSAAATEGEWTISGLEQSTQIWAETYVGETRDYNGNDADFIVALVNAFRTGQLVAVSDDAIERVARAMQDMPYMADWDDLETEDQDHMREMARIAIAAMKDTQPALAAKGTGDER